MDKRERLEVRREAFTEVIDELEAQIEEGREAFRGRFGVGAENTGLRVAVEIVQNMRGRDR